MLAGNTSPCLLSSQVVANAVAALSEISESHPNSNLLDLNPQNINKLLTALNECTEWGQIFILDCLSNYNPKDDREAQRYVGSCSLRGTWGYLVEEHLQTRGSVTSLKRACVNRVSVFRAVAAQITLAVQVA